MAEVQPTTDEWGYEVHPAFGHIVAKRMTVGPLGAALFDSDIRHNHTIRIEVTQARRKRSLNHDYIHSDLKPLIEVEMSEAQWASFVSSSGSSAVPCTIRATETNRQVPNVPYDPRLAHSMDEVEQAANRAFAKIQDALRDYDALDPKAPAKERREAMSKLRSSIKNSEANMVFAAGSLVEHAENVVQRARADIEAMVNAEATRLGLTPGDTVLQLPVGESG